MFIVNLKGEMLMSIPKTTFEGIRPYLSSHLNNFLSENFSNHHIPYCFRDSGITYSNNMSKFVNLRFKWHYSDDNVVDGLFIRVMSDDTLIAWIITGIANHRFIKIENGQTVSKSSENPDREDPFGSIRSIERAFTTLLKMNKETVWKYEDRMMGYFSKEYPLYDADGLFTVTDLDKPEAIAVYFKDARKLLPESIRQRVFVPYSPPIPHASTVNQTPIVPQTPHVPQNHKWIYFISGVALSLFISYIAYKILNRSISTQERAFLPRLSV